MRLRSAFLPGSFDGVLSKSRIKLFIHAPMAIVARRSRRRRRCLGRLKQMTTTMSTHTTHKILAPAANFESSPSRHNTYIAIIAFYTTDRPRGDRHQSSNTMLTGGFPNGSRRVPADPSPIYRMVTMDGCRQQGTVRRIGNDRKRQLADNYLQR